MDGKIDQEIREGIGNPSLRVPLRPSLSFPYVLSDADRRVGLGEGKSKASYSVSLCERTGRNDVRLPYCERWCLQRATIRRRMRYHSGEHTSRAKYGDEMKPKSNESNGIPGTPMAPLFFGET
jgi:hypothetical protein